MDNTQNGEDQHVIVRRVDQATFMGQPTKTTRAILDLKPGVTLSPETKRIIGEGRGWFFEVWGGFIGTFDQAKGLAKRVIKDDPLEDMFLAKVASGDPEEVPLIVEEDGKEVERQVRAFRIIWIKLLSEIIEDE